MLWVRGNCITLCIRVYKASLDRKKWKITQLMHHIKGTAYLNGISTSASLVMMLSGGLSWMVFV